jgi:hypothetical protein
MFKTRSVQRHWRHEKYRNLFEKPEQSGDLGVHGMIILKWILKKKSFMWIGFIWLRIS